MDGLKKGMPYHAELESSLADVPEKISGVRLTINNQWQYYFTSEDDFYSRFQVIE